MDFLHRTWAEIDIDALVHNFDSIKKEAAGAKLMAVVKADAYGHGMSAVVPQLLSLGVRSFAAATLDEGSQLRALGAEGTVLILGYASPQRAGELARLGLTQTVADLAHAEALNAQGVPLRVHLTQFTSCWLSSSCRFTRRVMRTFWELV